MRPDFLRKLYLCVQTLSIVCISIFLTVNAHKIGVYGRMDKLRIASLKIEFHFRGHFMCFLNMLGCPMFCDYTTPDHLNVQIETSGINFAKNGRQICVDFPIPFPGHAVKDLRFSRVFAQPFLRHFLTRAQTEQKHFKNEWTLQPKTLYLFLDTVHNWSSKY